MKLTVALLFIFGLVAFTVAAPVENPAETKEEQDPKEADEQGIMKFVSWLIALALVIAQTSSNLFYLFP